MAHGFAGQAFNSAAGEGRSAPGVKTTCRRPGHRPEEAGAKERKGKEVKVKKVSSDALTKYTSFL